MAFQPNDRVVHPTHGLGRVEEIVNKTFPGGEARLYYEVAFRESTVWVPVQERLDGGGLREITPRAQLDHYRDLLRQAPVPVNPDARQRRADINGLLKLGSFQVMCEVVRDLTAFGWVRPLKEVDAAMLRRAREGLTQEWAAVDGITLEQATQEIDALLREARQAGEAAAHAER
ncbi:MAG: CarD family transcriptional regulator [Chloroflexota bacterium]